MSYRIPAYPANPGSLFKASFVMPKGDPRNRFFYHTLTLMIDSYILTHPIRISQILPWDRNSCLSPDCDLRAVHWLDWKGLTSWLLLVLSFSHWYPESGVVLDCIDS